MITKCDKRYATIFTFLKRSERLFKQNHCQLTDSVEELLVSSASEKSPSIPTFWGKTPATCLDEEKQVNDDNIKLTRMIWKKRGFHLLRNNCKMFLCQKMWVTHTILAGIWKTRGPSVHEKDTRGTERARRQLPRRAQNTWRVINILGISSVASPYLPDSPNFVLRLGVFFFVFFC